MIKPSPLLSPLKLLSLVFGAIDDIPNSSGFLICSCRRDLRGPSHGGGGRWLWGVVPDGAAPYSEPLWRPAGLRPRAFRRGTGVRVRVRLLRGGQRLRELRRRRPRDLLGL